MIEIFYALTIINYINILKNKLSQKYFIPWE